MEYNNTLRDLFGVDLHAGDLLPSEGGGGEGFDNAGATLFITPVLMEKYLEAAELVLSTILPDSDAALEKANANAPRVLSSRPFDAGCWSRPLDLRSAPHAAARDTRRRFCPARIPPAGRQRRDRAVSGDLRQGKRSGTVLRTIDQDHAQGGAGRAEFLFLTETPPENPGVYQLNHLSLPPICRISCGHRCPIRS